MADDIQGALPTAPTNLGADPDAAQKYTQALAKVADSLEARNQTNWFDIAAGFLKPTRTGGFGESLGNASEAYGQQLKAQQANAPQLAMMRAQLAGQEYTLGNAAKLKAAQDAFIKDPNDKQAIADIAKYDPKGMSGVIDLAKSAPKVRSLLSGTQSTESTPFDVLAMDADPKISGQARQLQTQYRNGTIDDEKGNTLAQQMLSLSVNNDTRRELHGMMAGVNAQLKQAQIDKLHQESEGYLSPQQKIEFEKTISPVQESQRQAGQFLETLEGAKATIRQAPSGYAKGTWYNTVGKYTSPSDPKVIAQTSLESLAPTLVQLMPKFSPRGTVYDEQLHKKAIGELSDPTKSMEDRLAQVDRLEKTVREHMRENTKILDQWKANKTVYVPSESSIGGTSSSNASTAQIDTLRAQAADAIARGANPIKTKASFKSMTGMDY